MDWWHGLLTNASLSVAGFGNQPRDAEANLVEASAIARRGVQGNVDSGLALEESWRSAAGVQSAWVPQHQLCAQTAPRENDMITPLSSEGRFAF